MTLEPRYERETRSWIRSSVGGGCAFRCNYRCLFGDERRREEWERTVWAEKQWLMQKMTSAGRKDNERIRMFQIEKKEKGGQGETDGEMRLGERWVKEYGRRLGTEVRLTSCNWRGRQAPTRQVRRATDGRALAETALPSGRQRSAPLSSRGYFNLYFVLIAFNYLFGFVCLFTFFQLLLCFIGSGECARGTTDKDKSHDCALRIRLWRPKPNLFAFFDLAPFPLCAARVRSLDRVSQIASRWFVPRF